MTIQKIDGSNLYHAFSYGKREVEKNEQFLNQINVFPVPDGDTGTNMALTLRAILHGTKENQSISVVSAHMAEAALLGSRGNSGIIIAQFFQGLSDGLNGKKAIDAREFVGAVQLAVKKAYQAIALPKEGTILTVMNSWADALHCWHEHSGSFVRLNLKAFKAAQKSLRETTDKLIELKTAGVVDAGALGFVQFLEGVNHFLRHGKTLSSEVVVLEREMIHVNTVQPDLEYRYCTEAVVVNPCCEADTLRGEISRFGDSVIVAGSEKYLRAHLHTNQPDAVMNLLREKGRLEYQKVDDMRRQADVQFQRRASIALVSDSTCDIPEEILDKYQIHLVPLNLDIEGNQYLDKVTITPQFLYNRLQAMQTYPKSSQPSVKAFEALYSWLGTHYDSIISIHLSKELSGTWNAARTAANSLPDFKIDVVDSRQLATSLGLVVLKVAELLDSEVSHETVVARTKEFCRRAKILVSVRTLEYMVRGGRVSPLKGFMAKLFNLKPIVSVDPDGKSQLYGKSFGYQKNIKKIRKRVVQAGEERGLAAIAVGHVDALEEAETLAHQLEADTGMPVRYIYPVSPIIGVHAGIGVVCVAYLTKKE